MIRRSQSNRKYLLHMFHEKRLHLVVSSNPMLAEWWTGRSLFKVDL